MGTLFNVICPIVVDYFALYRDYISLRLDGYGMMCIELLLAPASVIISSSLDGTTARILIRLATVWIVVLSLAAVWIVALRLGFRRWVRRPPVLLPETISSLMRIQGAHRRWVLSVAFTSFRHIETPRRWGGRCPVLVAVHSFRRRATVRRRRRGRRRRHATTA